MSKNAAKGNIRVQTNLNNLTSDFDLCSPLNNNHNTHLNNLDTNIKTLETNNNILDVSTLSGHSANENVK